MSQTRIGLLGPIEPLSHWGPLATWNMPHNAPLPVGECKRTGCLSTNCSYSWLKVISDMFSKRVQHISEAREQPQAEGCGVPAQKTLWRPLE